jgi:hypothetical protein
MAGKQGLQQRLKAEIRKRQAQPRPQAVPTGNVRRDQWDEITRSHEDLLQNIEFTLVGCWQERDDIDDYTLHVALKGVMREDPPQNALAEYVFVRLMTIRTLREDVEPELWLDALRVVDQSVRDRSSLRPGDCSYLEFVLPYVAPALGDLDADYRVIEGRVSPPQLPGPVGDDAI